jgi:hypothetical protein
MEFRPPARPLRGRGETAGPFHSANESVSRRGFAGRTIVPRLRRKCAHSRSRNAGRIGSRRGVLVRYMILAGHSRGCKHGCGDHCSRNKFTLGHSISPVDVKSQSCWLLQRSGEEIDRLKKQLLTSLQRHASRPFDAISDEVEPSPRRATAPRSSRCQSESARYARDLRAGLI